MVFRGLVCVWKGWIVALHLALFCRCGRCLLLRELSSDIKDDCFWQFVHFLGLYASNQVSHGQQRMNDAFAPIGIEA